MAAAITSGVAVEVAGLLVALPQRQVLGVHAGLGRQAALVLLLEPGQDQALLGAEVVVELAGRHPGLLGHLAGRQAGVALGQQPGLVTLAILAGRYGVDSRDGLDWSPPDRARSRGRLWRAVLADLGCGPLPERSRLPWTTRRSRRLQRRIVLRTPTRSWASSIRSAPQQRSALPRPACPFGRALVQFART
jgi:hypothetical protein